MRKGLCFFEIGEEKIIDVQPLYHELPKLIEGQEITLYGEKYTYAYVDHVYNDKNTGLDFAYYYVVEKI